MRWAAARTARWCLSHRASLEWLVLTRMLETTRVGGYDGPWTEWGSIVGTRWSFDSTGGATPLGR